MTEESSEVPRELTGKSGAAAGSPSAPAHPSPPPPCPPPPSCRSREVAAPLRSQPCWAGRRELCSRLAAWKAQSGEGGRGGQRGLGARGASPAATGGIAVGGREGRAASGLGVLEARSTLYSDQSTAPNSGKSGKGQCKAGGRVVGERTVGRLRHLPAPLLLPPRGAPPIRRLRGGGASLECGRSRARRGFAQPAGSERVTGVTHARAGKPRVNATGLF